MDISKIKVGSTSYDVKDAVARYAIDNLGPEVVTADRVKAALGVTEDGERFLKEDGTWQLINDPYAIIRVNLQEFLNNSLANGDGLSGIVVSVQNTTDNTPAVTKTYAGDELVFDGLIPVKAYRVSVLSRTGYKLDYAYQDITILDVGSDVTKTFKYEADVYTAEMTSNWDLPNKLDTRVDRTSNGVYLQARYTYEENVIESGQLHNGDTFKVPIDVDSSFEIYGSSDVSGFTKTNTIDSTNKKLCIYYYTTVPLPLEGFIILDDTTNVPSNKVLDENLRYGSNYTRPAVITAIRNASHCYVQQSFSDGTMTIKQLDDSDGTKYADGTDASTDITTNNVFMRLPVFYTKVSTYTTNKTKIEFYFDQAENSIPQGSGWEKWGGVLIGKYKASLKDNDKLASISGVSPSYVTFTNAERYGKNVGAGFHCVQWEQHCIMAILFYGYYGNTNSQAICGPGQKSSSSNNGETNGNGMSDTIAANSYFAISFWGLENWWGRIPEFIENIRWYNRMEIFDDSGNLSRTIESGIKTMDTYNSTHYPSKFYLGQHLDLIPSNTSTNASTSTGYCDLFSLNAYSGYKIGRGEQSYDTTYTSHTGITEVKFYSNSTTLGTRLIYKGNIIKI